MKKLVIDVKSTVKEGKTRRFSAVMLGYVTADLLWEGGGHQTETRPVYITVAGTDAALRPFLANFHSKGAKADLHLSDRSSWDKSRHWFRCLKSAKYEAVWQRDADPGGVHMVSLFQRSLFAADPGLIDPDCCSFLSVPPLWWHNEQLATIRADHELAGKVVAHARALGLLDTDKETRIGVPITFEDEEAFINMLPQAAHFMMCFDKRTRRPLVNDLAFALQVYLSALADGLASTSKQSSWDWARQKWASNGFSEISSIKLGLKPGVIMHVRHERLDEFLTNQVKLYSEVQHG